jgi:hypothetical protein
MISSHGNSLIDALLRRPLGASIGPHAASRNRRQSFAGKASLLVPRISDGGHGRQFGLTRMNSPLSRGFSLIDAGFRRPPRASTEPRTASRNRHQSFGITDWRPWGMAHMETCANSLQHGLVLDRRWALMLAPQFQ